MKCFALACAFLLTANGALAAEPAVRSSARPAIVAVPRAPAQPSTNPVLTIDPSALTKYDPAKDVGKLLKAVAELQAEVSALKAANAALEAQVKNMDEAMGKQFLSNLAQTKKLDALVISNAGLDTLKSNFATLSSTFATHTHTVPDSTATYVNREVVTNSHATGDDYTTIGSVTQVKTLVRISSTPSTKKGWISPDAGADD